MKCEEVLTRLEDYSYGEISDADGARLAAHLRDCHSCKAAYAVILKDNETFYSYVSGIDATSQMWEGVRTGIRSLEPVAKLGSVDRLKSRQRAVLFTVPTQPAVKHTVEDFMSQGIFTFIEYEPIWVSVVGELQEAVHEFIQDPKKFIADLFRSDPLQARRQRYMRVGATCAIFFWALSSILYLGWYYHKPAQVVTDAEQFQKIVDLAPLPAESLQARKMEKPASGGGGGGDRETTPPSLGRLPRASLENPIVPPSTHPSEIKQPSLPVMPTVQAQPELLPQQAMNLPLGDPKGVPGLPSDGPGEDGGIGLGKGGSVGPGDGRGFGPGHGYNTLGGEGSIGGVDREIYTTGQPGVKSPQILAKMKPKYTEEARRNKIQGAVVLSAVFRKDGTIGDIKVVQGLGYGLDEEAVKAAALIRFIPGVKNGQPVNVRARLEFSFSLL